MRRNWLGLASSRDEQDGLGESGNLAPAGEKNPTDAVPTFHVDLLPMEDIYRAAGIMSPPKGYGIKKVVDMLHSEYVRGLAPGMKRAAVLMALDAAGIPMGQLQQDAQARQDALNSYEAGQRQQVEAEWARKAEENVQIQAEMERLKTHHLARISRNLDAIALEKATFGSWLAVKQQETQSISEAVDLCLKPAPSEPAASSPAETGRTDASRADAGNGHASNGSHGNGSPGNGAASAKPASPAVKGLLPDAAMTKAAAAGKPM